MARNRIRATAATAEKLVKATHPAATMVVTGNGFDRAFFIKVDGQTFVCADKAAQAWHNAAMKVMRADGRMPA